jgi:serine phosphatase RsbU (regulator of sigma subunit)
MGQLRSAVRAFASGGEKPEHVLACTNRLMLDLDPGLLASCLLLRLTPDLAHVHGARAGHLPPLLRRPGGCTEILQLSGGPLLGVDARAVFPPTTLALPDHSVLALYTDGLVEEAGASIDAGIDRLRTTLAHHTSPTPEALADLLVAPATRTAHRSDDVALLLAART